MNIAIDRLSIHLGASVTPERARTIGALIGEALQNELRTHAPEINAAPAGYQVQSMTVPGIRISADAGDIEIANLVANAIARSLLIELEV
jgi:hypothetical protein